MNALRRQPGSYVRKSLFVVFCAVLAAMLLVGGARAQEGGCVLSEAMATTFAERFDAIFDGPSVEIADEIFAPNFVAHLPLAPELDREGWKNYVVSFYMGVPDLTEAVDQVIVSDDRVVVHVTYTGTHDGPLLGIPATGKSVTMKAIGIFSFDENCLATENWAVLDVVGVLTQIGAFPPAAAQDGTPAPDERSAAYRETLFRFVDEGIIPGNFDLMIELLPEEYVVHTPLGDLDRQGVVAFFSALRGSLSDFSAVQHQVIVEGDLAAGRHTISGTFDAAEFASPLGVLQPNGQPVELNIINMWRFNEEGLIVEEWVQFDVLGFFTQMGAFPPATAAAADEAPATPLPAPTGPYKVGVEWRHWVDESRDETFDESETSKREMMVQFLYPADSTAEGAPADYLANPQEVLPAFESLMTLVGLQLSLPVSDFEDFSSYAIPNAALAGDLERYPVLIFSHGAAADVTMYSAQLEELASHGYVVAAINHAYGAGAVVFPDGRVVNGNYAAGLEVHVPIWAQDQIFVMDKLEELNSSDPEGRFTNRLDLERIGVFGQSLGGAAATLTCYLDARCKAGASGDGPVYGDVVEAGLDQPFLYLLSDSHTNYNPEFAANVRGPYYEVAAAGFEHLDFGDFTLWPNPVPMRDALWLGSVEGARAVEITRAALLTFFDRYVKGQAETSMDALSAYPEITLTARNSEAP